MEATTDTERTEAVSKFRVCVLQSVLLKENYVITSREEEAHFKCTLLLTDFKGAP